MTIILFTYASKIRVKSTEAYLLIHMITKASINIIFVLIGFVTQNDKNVERERVKTSLVSIRRLVASLSPIACITGLLLISTTTLAQNSSTDDMQSEITAVDRKIVPANSSTVKANVTIIPLTNVTGIYN